MKIRGNYVQNITKHDHFCFQHIAENIPFKYMYFSRERIKGEITFNEAIS